MKKILHRITLLILALSAANMLAAPGANVDKNGIGLQGYDPVAFFTDGKPVLGQAEFTALIMM